MSLVVSHVGYDFVTIGADRGLWQTRADGVPTSAPAVMSRSKVHSIPGVPVVIATVGAWYDGWIDAWIADHPIDPATYSLPELAKAFVADYFAYHDPRAKARLAGLGLELPGGKLQPHTPELLAAGASVIVAGLQPNWPRAQIWTAAYPDRDVNPIHYDIARDEEGSIRRVEKAAIYVMGNYEPLGPFIESANHEMDRERSLAFISTFLDVRERLGRTESPIPILAPFDIVRLTHDGVEWLAGNEGQVGALGCADFALAYDSNGNLIKSTSLNNQASVPPTSTVALSAAGSYPSGGTPTVTISWSAFTFNFPDGSTASLSAGSAVFVSLTASTTYYYTAYASVSAGVASVTVTPIGSASPSQMQAYAIYLDKRIPLTNSLYCTTPASSGGSSGGGGGGGSLCPSVDQPVLTQERGIIPAGEYEPGMHLMGPDGEWVEILACRNQWAQMMIVTVLGEAHEVDTQHLWQKPYGDWVKTCDLALGTLLKGCDGAVYSPEKIEVGKVKMLRVTTVAGGVFRIGKLIGHNVITQ